MKCVDVVKTVLDETYRQVPNAGKGRDAIISARISASSDAYGNVMATGGPDFSDAATRFGYVFSYVMAHGHWLHELAGMEPSIKKIFERGRARVCCIGGGPGSDIVGLLKFLDENDIECKLFCEIIDGCEAWKATWSDVAYVMDLDGSLHTDYVIHDVGDEQSWHAISQIEKADVITLSFFISEIFHIDAGKKAKKYLNTMLGRAKEGAVVLVNDNFTKGVYKLIDEVASECGFETLVGSEGKRKIYDSGEDLATLRDYSTRFSKSSRLTGDRCWRIYKKSGA
jgi:hypothetical protein